MRAILLLALASAACGDNARGLDCADTPATCRMTCGYGAGDRARDTLADVAPKDIPLDTIVLVMQENRTFDHYFSQLTMPGQTLDVAAPDATQPDPTTPGATVSRFHQTAYCFDNPAESWDEVHDEVDGGAMDGFAMQNAQADDPQGLRTLGYYDETDIPYYYALARAFAISDRHFSSVQANTWTNRAFYMAGTSFGITTNTFPPAMDAMGNPLPDLFTRLDDAKVTWSFYAQDVPTLAILFGTYAKNLGHVNPYEQYFTDAAAGKLAQVVFVEGSDQKGGVSPDEDPPGDMQVGQQMVHDVVAALAASPHWPKSALFFSFDEQGGLYDHVAPQPACVPDDYQPQAQARRRAGGVRPDRPARAADGDLAVRQARVRLARRHRSHEHPAVPRDEVRPARPHPPRRERGAAVRHVRLRLATRHVVPDAARRDARRHPAVGVRREVSADDVRTRRERRNDRTTE